MEGRIMEGRIMEGRIMSVLLKAYVSCVCGELTGNSYRETEGDNILPCTAVLFPGTSKGCLTLQRRREGRGGEGDTCITRDITDQLQQDLMMLKH
jgi:hypothetical protein